MRIRTILKKGTGLVLSTMIILSFSPGQVYAVTYEEDHEQTEGWNENVAVIAEENDVTVKGGDISYDGSESEYGGYGALYVSAESSDDESDDPYTADVKTGSVTYSSEATDEEAAAVYVDVFGGEANVTVNGDVTINGDYEAEADEPIFRDGICSRDIYGETNITVNGDVNGAYRGIYADEKLGETNIAVNGDANGGAAGVVVQNFHGSTNVEVTGDTNGEEAGVFILNDYESEDEDMDDVISPGTVEVRVEGTISAAKPDGVGIMVYGNTEDINVTTWAITPNKDGWVAATFGDDFETVQDKNFEENNINYIIRVDTSVMGATLSASKETAFEQDKVYLRIDLDDGYTITGAYDDNGISGKNILQQDENGYYVVVPKGGGVLLSVTLEESGSEPVNPSAQSGNTSDQDKNKSTDKTVNTDDQSVVNNSIVQMILNAAPGEVITVNILTGTSLDKSVVDALEARPDVSLVVNYGFNGVIFSATIPAGTVLTSYRNAAGGINFDTLTVHFGGVQIS